MLLALFLIDLAAGLIVFLPLTGRRNAGVKFYRLILVIAGVLAACAGASHALAHRRDLGLFDAALAMLCAIVLLVLRYPKRLVYRVPAFALAAGFIACGVVAWHEAARMSWLLAAVGALSSIALLGSVNLAMLLGHWYLVVRGMSIDPLKRLTIATLVSTIAKVLVVTIAIIATGSFNEVAVRQGIFFWMRALWGLLGPLMLYPMVWGTVRMRSTMAATGILYVDVVAVVIGEVLGAWLSAIAHVPV